MQSACALPGDDTRRPPRTINSRTIFATRFTPICLMLFPLSFALLRGHTPPGRDSDSRPRPHPLRWLSEPRAVAGTPSARYVPKPPSTRDAGAERDRRSGTGRGAALLGAARSGRPVARADDRHERDEPSRSAESGWRIVADARQIEDSPHDIVVVGVVVDAGHPEGIGRTRRGKGPKASEPKNQEEDEPSSPPHGRHPTRSAGWVARASPWERRQSANPCGRQTREASGYECDPQKLGVESRVRPLQAHCQFL